MQDSQKKMQEDLQAEEDKVNHLNKIKSKVEGGLTEAEDVLERERRTGQVITYKLYILYVLHIIRITFNIQLQLHCRRRRRPRGRWRAN